MIGIDVVDIAGLSARLRESPGLEERLFTAGERSYCRSGTKPEVRFAGTLAAKEAVVKALGLDSLVAWAGRIEVVRTASGAPEATVAGGSKPLVISISHDGPVAVAVAFVQETAETG